MLDKLTKDDFSKHLNRRFLIHVHEQDPLETELVEVRGLVAPDDDPDRRQPFSLIFLGPAEVALEQGIFTVENENLGKLDIFLVTLGPDEEGMRHESIFG